MNQITSLCIAACTFSCLPAIAQDQLQTQSGRNIISISPVSVSEYTLTGVSLQWEHFLGAAQKWSLELPLQYTFGHSDPCDPAVRTRIAWFAPALRYYPFGSQRNVSYAVGVNAAVGKGMTNCNCGEDNSATGINGDVMAKGSYKPLTTLGMLVNNEVNVKVTDKLCAGAGSGIGFAFMNKVGNNDMGGDLMLHFDLRIGYRF